MLTGIKVDKSNKIVLYFIDYTGKVMSAESMVILTKEYINNHKIQNKRVMYKAGKNYNDRYTLYQELKKLNIDSWDLILTKDNTTGAMCVCHEIKKRFLVELQNDMGEDPQKLTGELLKGLVDLYEGECK